MSFESEWQRLAKYKVSKQCIEKLTLPEEDKSILRQGLPLTEGGFDFSVAEGELRPLGAFFPPADKELATALVLARVPAPSTYICLVPKDGSVQLVGSTSGARIVNSSLHQFAQSVLVFYEYCQGPTDYTARAIARTHKRLKTLLTDIDKAALESPDSDWSDVLQMIKDGVM